MILFSASKKIYQDSLVIGEMFGTENPRMIDEHSEFPLIYDFDRSKSFDLGFDVCSWISLVLVLKEYRDRYYVSCMILGRFAQESVNSLELRIQDQDSWVSFAPTVDFDHARFDQYRSLIWFHICFLQHGYELSTSVSTTR